MRIDDGSAVTVARRGGGGLRARQGDANLRNLQTLTFAESNFGLLRVDSYQNAYLTTLSGSAVGAYPQIPAPSCGFCTTANLMTGIADNVPSMRTMSGSCGLTDPTRFNIRVWASRVPGDALTLSVGCDYPLYAYPMMSANGCSSGAVVGNFTAVYKFTGNGSTTSVTKDVVW